MNKTISNLLKFSLFVGLGAGILYLVYQNQNVAYMAECGQKGIPSEDCSLIKKVVADFRSVNYFWIIMVILAFTFSNISRAIRWQMLLRPMGYSTRFVNAFFTTILGYFANLGFPRLGELVRPASLARYEKIPVEEVLGTVVLDRIMDVLSIAIVSSIALALEYRTIWRALDGHIAIAEKFHSLWNSALLWLLIGIALSIISGFYFFRKRLAQSNFWIKIVRLVSGFAEGLRSIVKINQPVRFIFHSINIWLMYYLMTYLCFFSFAPTAELPAVAALMVFVFGAWGIVIPAPGGMGTYHFLAVIALSIYGISGDDAFSFANISFFSIQIFSNILLGLLALLLLPIVNKRYTPKHHTQAISEVAETVKG